MDHKFDSLPGLIRWAPNVTVPLLTGIYSVVFPEGVFDKLLCRLLKCRTSMWQYKKKHEKRRKRA
jgi:hypothetical protein